MQFRTFFSACAALSLPLFASSQPASAEDAIRLEPVWSKVKVERPVTIQIPPDGSGRYFLVQQTGKILILPKDSVNGTEAETFIDFSKRMSVENDFEEGLLGLAFHPKFKENGKYYVNYSRQDPKQSVVSEITASPGDDLATERVLLTVPQPFWNHNSGNLIFGPDGMLYLSFGDGGKRDDPYRLAQNPFDFHGKILRVDVNTRTGGRQYGVPADNPFVNKEGVLPEIWALGLRNPWGLYIDEKTGVFWCADVGQDLWEEVNIIEKGGNYGWNFREGNRPFQLRKDAPPQDAKFIEPIVEYSRDQGISITGGFVYRGKALPELEGHYIYGDWGSGRVWAVTYDHVAKKAGEPRLLLNPAGNPNYVKPTAFCPDENGEILVLDWNGGIYKVLPK